MNQKGSDNPEESTKQASILSAIEKTTKISELLLGFSRSLTVALTTLLASLFSGISQFFIDDVSSWKLAGIIAVVGLYFVANLLFEKFFSDLGGMRVEIKIAAHAVEILLPQTKNREEAAREIAISLTYLKHLRRKNAMVKGSLALTAIALAIASVNFPAWDLLNLAAAAGVTLSLFLIKEFVVEYRIRKGFYGNNRSEAKTLISFIVQNADDIDFTDGNGKLRKALLPQSKNGETTNHGVIGGGVATT